MNLFIIHKDGFFVKLDSKCSKEEFIYSKMCSFNTEFGLLMETAINKKNILDLINDNEIFDGMNYKYLYVVFIVLLYFVLTQWIQLVVKYINDKKLEYGIIDSCN